MLRQVFIYYKNQRIYFSQFGKALDEDSFESVLKKLQQEAFTKGQDPNAVGSYDFYKYRISFIASPEKEIIYIFVTDLTDSVDNIKTQLQVCRREFLELFESVLSSQFDNETFEIFHPTIEKIHKELRPKISLVGFSGVGKTTITKLIRAEEIPMEHVPTITGEIGTIKIGKLSFALWDFAGQEQFSFLWNKFVKGSDAVLLITDSTLENVEKSRFFTELVKQEAPHAHMAIIGNKQDLPGAMPATEIERILGGIHTYSMVATDPANRDKMITIIADILEMSAEVSPLLKPLIERDKKMACAEEALMNGDFQGAYRLFNEIADLCLELGDDSLSAEFHQKADKVKGYLSQMTQATKAPTEVTASSPGSAVSPLVFDTEENQQKPQITDSTSTPLVKPLTVPLPNIKPGPPLPTGGTQARLVKPISPPLDSKSPANASKPPPPPVHQPTLAPPLVFNPPPADLVGDGKEETLPHNTNESPAVLSPPPAFKPLPQKPDAITSKPPVIPPSAIPTPSANPPNENPKITPPPFAKPTPPAPKITPPSFAQPVSAASTSIPASASSEGVEADNITTMKRQINATLMDLKIKVANMNKFLLEIEMKNLTGEMPDAEFDQKKKRAETMKAELERQIRENQELLKSMG